MKDVRDCVAIKYDEGNDLELLLETQEYNFDKVADTKLLKIGLKTEDDEEHKYMFQQDYSEYRKREKTYKANNGS